jgi:hypothetical protein
MLLAIGLAVAAGIGIGSMLAGGSGGMHASSTKTPGDQPVNETDSAIQVLQAASPADTRLVELSRRLQDEIRARQALELKLESLARQVAVLDRAAGASGTAGPGEQPADDTGDRDRDWFDEQALLDNGMDQSLASELKVFFEQLEMDRLYLRDRSAREGWDRAQLRAELQAIESREEDLRQRLGDDAYDAYLYASGQPNRVAVTSVLASAQAGQAGIQSGDHILRYDNQRIYSWMDLREATTSGDISDMVEVEVERDGTTLQFYLARGPMGIRMDSLSVAP